MPRPQTYVFENTTEYIRIYEIFERKKQANGIGTVRRDGVHMKRECWRREYRADMVGKDAEKIAESIKRQST